MKKLLLTTALIAISSTSAFANDLNTIRNSLTTVYSDFSGNFSTYNDFNDNGTGDAADALAELARAIDNPIIQEGVEAQMGDVVTADSLMNDDGTLTTITEDPGFGTDFVPEILEDINAKVATLVAAVDYDLFRIGDNTTDNPDWGLASGRLDGSIALLESYNDLAIDPNASVVIRESAWMLFKNDFNSFVDDYNNAVSVLGGLSDITATNYAEFGLGGHDGYASYTDWAIDNPIPVSEVRWEVQGDKTVVAVGEDYAGFVNNNPNSIGEFHAFDENGVAVGPFPTIQAAIDFLGAN